MRSSLQRWMWPALAALVATLPVAGGISNARIFHFRDMAKHFWPYHQWEMRTIASGWLPLWNPDLGGGYPAIADATSQLLFFPTLPIRLLLPEALGFNLAIVLCYPFTALGAFLFLRRHATAEAASVGAIVLAVSGPLLSLGNMPNLAWSAALIPWALWRVDAVAARPGAREVAWLALVFGAQLLAGEPVTLILTAALAVAYALWRAWESEARWAPRAAVVALVIGGGLLGLMLGAVQALPLADVVGRSLRGAGALDDMWALHPASLAEAVAPSVFGSTLEPVGWKVSWYRAFNGGREPLLLSIYVGAPALGLALLGGVAGRRRGWTVFWSAVAVVAVVCALGAATPVFPLLREYVPLVRTFRYPSKFVVFAAVAVSALAAVGWDALRSRESEEGGEGGEISGRRRAWTVAVVCLVAAAGAALAVWAATPDAAAVLAAESSARNLESPLVEAGRFAASLQASGIRLFAVSALAGLLIWYAPRAPLVRWALVALLAADLVSANAGLNPTLDLADMQRPEWVANVRDATRERVFISTGRNLADTNLPLITAPLPPQLSTATVSSLFVHVFPARTTGLGARSALDEGLSALRPAAYERVHSQYDAASPAERARFLERNCVRYYLTIAPPAADARRIVALPDFNAGMSLYERPVASPRAEVVPTYLVVRDEGQQAAALFSSQIDPSATVVLASDPPEPAGVAGEPVAPAAEIEGEEPNRVTVRAGAPEGGGFLVLRDAFDPGWYAEVDGREAEIVRANAMHRAVRLAPGAHTVVLSYRPRSLTIGAVVSLAALLVVLGLLISPWRRRAFISDSSSPS